MVVRSILFSFSLSLLTISAQGMDNLGSFVGGFFGLITTAANTVIPGERQRYNSLTKANSVPAKLSTTSKEFKDKAREFLYNRLSVIKIGDSEAKLTTLIETGLQKHKSAVLIAVYFNNKPLLDWIISQNGDVNERIGDEIPLIVAAQLGYKQICKTLLQAGAHINAPGFRGTTALTTAAGRGHAEICRLLLDHGASVDTQEHAPEFCEEYSALMRATLNNHPETVRFLLERGANVRLLNWQGNCAFRIAANDGGALEICDLFIEKSGIDEAAASNEDKVLALERYAQSIVATVIRREAPSQQRKQAVTELIKSMLAIPCRELEQFTRIEKMPVLDQMLLCTCLYELDDLIPTLRAQGAKMNAVYDGRSITTWNEMVQNRFYLSENESNLQFIEAFGSNSDLMHSSASTLAELNAQFMRAADSSHYQQMLKLLTAGASLEPCGGRGSLFHESCNSPLNMFYFLELAREHYQKNFLNQIALEHSHKSSRQKVMTALLALRRACSQLPKPLRLMILESALFHDIIRMVLAAHPLMTLGSVSSVEKSINFPMREPFEEGLIRNIRIKQLIYKLEHGMLQPISAESLVHKHLNIAQLTAQERQKLAIASIAEPLTTLMRRRDEIGQTAHEKVKLTLEHLSSFFDPALTTQIIEELILEPQSKVKDELGPLEYSIYERVH